MIANNFKNFSILDSSSFKNLIFIPRILTHKNVNKIEVDTTVATNDARLNVSEIISKNLPIKERVAEAAMGIAMGLIFENNSFLPFV